MFNQQDDDDKPLKSWWPYIIGMGATAILSTLGSELVKWGVEELRTKYGTKDKKPNDKEGLHPSSEDDSHTDVVGRH